MLNLMDWVLHLHIYVDVDESTFKFMGKLKEIYFGTKKLEIHVFLVICIFCELFEGPSCRCVPTLM